MAASIAAVDMSLVLWDPCLPMHTPVLALHVCGLSCEVKAADNKLDAMALVLNEAERSDGLHA